MIVFDLLSSVFDILTFLTLRRGFHASATLSRSGWLIESTITELAVMLVLRTNRPLLPKPPRPSAVIHHHRRHHEITLPYSPLAGPLGLIAVPARVLAAPRRAHRVLRHRQRRGPDMLPTDDPIHKPRVDRCLG